MAKLPDKRETLLAFLARGVAMLHLDARRPGVVVPPQHAEDAHLLLNLSYRYAIPDLTIDARGVQATLSFRSQPFRCTLPWTAVFGITSQPSGADQAWPEDIPPEVAAQFEAPAGGGARPKAGPKAVRKPKPAAVQPRLRALDEAPEKGAPVVPAEGEGATSEEAPRPAARGHLRLVK